MRRPRFSWRWDRDAWELGLERVDIEERARYEPVGEAIPATEVARGWGGYAVPTPNVYAPGDCRVMFPVVDGAVSYQLYLQVGRDISLHETSLHLGPLTVRWER